MNKMVSSRLEGREETKKLKMSSNSRLKKQHEKKERSEKMNTYEVKVSLEMYYVIDAPCESAAANMAMDWFAEAEPEVDVKQLDED